MYLDYSLFMNCFYITYILMYICTNRKRNYVLSGNYVLNGIAILLRILFKEKNFANKVSLITDHT